MAKEEGGITNLFNDVSFGGLVKSALFIGIGFFVGGVIDYTFFHDHPMGKEIISAFRDPLGAAFDNVANLIGRSDLTRNTDFLDDTGATLEAPDPFAMMGI